MESNVFSTELDEKLIDLVRGNPVLYDMNRKNYKDTTVKHNMWKEIAESLNLGVNQCQARWKTIRDTHRRNLNRLKSKTTSGSPAFSKSKYTNKALQFLDSTFKESPVMTTITVVKPPTGVGEGQPSFAKNNGVIESQLCEEVHLSEAEVDDEFSQVEEFDENDSSEVKKSEEIKSVQPRKKFKKSSKERMVEMVKAGREERNNMLIDLAVAKQNKFQNTVKEHAVDMFFSSMAEVVKTFPPHLIAEARMKVCQLVSELEFRAIQQTAPPHATTSGFPNLLTECDNFPPKIKTHTLMHTPANTISSGTTSSNSEYNSPND